MEAVVVKKMAFLVYSLGRWIPLCVEEVDGVLHFGDDPGIVSTGVLSRRMLMLGPTKDARDELVAALQALNKGWTVVGSLGSLRSL